MSHVVDGPARDQWGEHEHASTIGPLDLDAEVARHG